MRYTYLGYDTRHLLLYRYFLQVQAQHTRTITNIICVVLYNWSRPKSKSKSRPSTAKKMRIRPLAPGPESRIRPLALALGSSFIRSWNTSRWRYNTNTGTHVCHSRWPVGFAVVSGYGRYCTYERARASVGEWPFHQALNLYYTAAVQFLKLLCSSCFMFQFWNRHTAGTETKPPTGPGAVEMSVDAAGSPSVLSVQCT